MNRNLRKILEFLMLLGIILCSVLIFINRDRLQGLGISGYAGLFILCFLSNATVFLPAPSLIVASSFAAILNPFLVALVGSLGSSAGELVGYLFGSISSRLSDKMESFLIRMKKYFRSSWIPVFILALLPLPLFDAAGVYSGGTKMKLSVFFLACWAGKMIKMMIYIAAFLYLGDKAGWGGI